MRRVLVTGQHGFVGKTLADMISLDAAFSGWQLVETSETLDVRNRNELTAIVEDHAFDAVIHFAAQSNVPEAFRDPAATLHVNVVGTLNLLQALHGAAFSGRMLYVSTGDVYGQVDEADLPVSESHPPAPRNPYSVSKLAAEALCRQWVMTEGMDIVLARPFNHIGRRQSDRFVVSDFARQIVAIKRGKRDPIVVAGDVDTTRDFTDVRDVVCAYFRLLEDGSTGDIYNVCSGHERSIRFVLERLAQLAGVDVSIRIDAARLRKSEQRRMRGDASKIRRDTGWEATTPLDESLASMLDYWESEANE